MAKNSDIDSIRMIITESPNSDDSMICVIHGATKYKNTTANAVTLSVIITKYLCFSGRRDRKGKNVLMKICNRLLNML